MPAPRSDPFQLSLEPGAGPDDDNTPTPTPIRRDRPSLLHQLSIIDAEGWDGRSRRIGVGVGVLSSSGPAPGSRLSWNGSDRGAGMVASWCRWDTGDAAQGG